MDEFTLVEKSAGTGGECRRPHLGMLDPAHEDDVRTGVDVADALGGGQAVRIRHFDLHHDPVGLMAAVESECLFSGCGFEQFVSGLREDIPDERPGCGVVIDDEDDLGVCVRNAD